MRDRHRPAFMARLSAYSLDLSLTYFLTFFLSPTRDLLGLTGDALLLGLEASWWGISLARVIGLLVITQVMRFYAVIFFGHTLFSPMFGLYPKEGILWSRLGGGLRIAVESFLAPVIFVQALIYPSKLLLSEKWTRTETTQKSYSKLAWFAHFITPLLVVMSFYSPLFSNMTLFDGVVVVEEEIKPRPLEAKQNFDLFKLYRSERFRLESLSDLGKGRFHLLPDYDFRRSSGQLRVVPFVKIVDTEQRRVVYFKVGPDLRWGPILQRSGQGMPFWPNQYPALFKEMKSLNEEERKGDKGKQFSAEACSDIQRLVKKSFELSPGRLIDHTLSSGPFIRGLIQTRQVLLEIIDPTSAPQVDLITLGKTPFLRFRQRMDHANDHSSRHTLLPLCTTRSPYFEINTTNDLASDRARTDFMENFLAKASWNFESFEKDEIPKQRRDFHLFHLIDGLMDSNITEDQRLKLEEGTSYMLFNLGNLSFQDELIDTHFQNSLERIAELVSLMDERDETVFTKSFLFYLEQLKMAIKNKNADYFAAGLKDIK